MRKRPKPHPVPHPVARATTAIAGLDAPVEVRRHPGARRMTLRVSRTKRAVIVTIPFSCKVEEADSFVNRHLDWVLDRLGTVPDPVPFKDGAALPLRGVFHVVRFAATKAQGPLVTRIADPGAGPVLEVAGHPSHASRHLMRWLAEEARHDLEERVAFHALRLGLQAKRIAVRDQSSRWGSCSTTGVLSFSWRLVLAPPPVLDYVAAHEVAHLAEMNHGPRFWALVRQTCPEMGAAKQWLVAYGTGLHRYGPQA